MLLDLTHLFPKYREIEGEVYQVEGAYLNELSADSNGHSLYTSALIDEYEIVQDSYEDDFGDERKVFLLYVR